MHQYFFLEACLLSIYKRQESVVPAVLRISDLHAQNNNKTPHAARWLTEVKMEATVYYRSWDFQADEDVYKSNTLS